MHVLVVEDDVRLAEALKAILENNNYQCDVVHNGADGLAYVESGIYDVMVLDVMLPKMNGFEVCTRVRRKLSTPIIMVTAREDEKDKILGLDTGADDYVTKPFSFNELLARIKSNIRRSSGELIAEERPADAGSMLTVRGLSIDTERYAVERDGNPIELSKKEYDLLVFLASNLGRPFSREELLEQVWGYEGFYGDIRTVDVTVKRLRDKLEADPSKPEYLFTKRGVGYYLR
jgi:two-component system response regulator VicR